jgi:hypothetical protein
MGWDTKDVDFGRKGVSYKKKDANDKDSNYGEESETIKYEQLADFMAENSVML